MISINPKVTSKIEDSVTITKEVKATEPKAEISKFQDCVPANWVIILEGDNFTARNNNSGETFKGTIAEFNAKLRG
jgi:hypothetical protein